MKTRDKTAEFTAGKNENDEAATAPTVTASEPVPENLENSSEGLPQHEASMDGVQVDLPAGAEMAPSTSHHSEKNAAVEDLGPPMTAEEMTQRDQLVTVASKGLAGAMVAYQALWQIRERKLFRATHKSFPEFCREVLDISEGRASQLITHAMQCKELKEHFTDSQIPSSERAIRELRRVKASERVKVFEKALELAGGERPKTVHILEARTEVEGVKGVAAKENAPQLITLQDAMSAAETLKEFLEKCDRDNLRIGDAKKMSDLTKSIADLAATRHLAA